MHPSDKKPAIIIGISIIIIFAASLFIVKNRGTYHDRAVDAFSNYTTIHHIDYKSYNCGTYPTIHGIICTYEKLNDSEPRTVMCECGFIAYNNSCYPVNNFRLEY